MDLLQSQVDAYTWFTTVGITRCLQAHSPIDISTPHVRVQLWLGDRTGKAWTLTPPRLQPMSPSSFSSSSSSSASVSELAETWMRPMDARLHGLDYVSALHMQLETKWTWNPAGLRAQKHKNDNKIRKDSSKDRKDSKDNGTNSTGFQDSFSEKEEKEEKEKDKEEKEEEMTKEKEKEESSLGGNKEFGSESNEDTQCLFADLALDAIPILLTSEPEDVDAGGYFIMQGKDVFLPTSVQKVATSLLLQGKQQTKDNCGFLPMRVFLDDALCVWVQWTDTVTLPLFVCLRALYIESDKQIFQLCLQTYKGSHTTAATWLVPSANHAASLALFSHTQAHVFLDPHTFWIPTTGTKQMELAYQLGQQALLCLEQHHAPQTSAGCTPREQLMATTFGERMYHAFFDYVGQYAEQLKHTLQTHVQTMFDGILPVYKPWSFRSLSMLLRSVLTSHVYTISCAAWKTWLSTQWKDMPSEGLWLARTSLVRNVPCLEPHCPFGYVDPCTGELCVGTRVSSLSCAYGSHVKRTLRWLQTVTLSLDWIVAISRHHADKHDICVYVNNEWCASCRWPLLLVHTLRTLRRYQTGIHPDTSIAFDFQRQEVHVHTCAGRVLRVLRCNKKLSTGSSVCSAKDNPLKGGSQGTVGSLDEEGWDWKQTCAQRDVVHTLDSWNLSNVTSIHSFVEQVEAKVQHRPCPNVECIDWYEEQGLRIGSSSCEPNTNQATAEHSSFLRMCSHVEMHNPAYGYGWIGLQGTCFRNHVSFAHIHRSLQPLCRDTLVCLSKDKEPSKEPTKEPTVPCNPPFVVCAMKEHTKAKDSPPVVASQREGPRTNGKGGLLRGTVGSLEGSLSLDGSMSIHMDHCQRPLCVSHAMVCNTPALWLGCNVVVALLAYQGHAWTVNKASLERGLLSTHVGWWLRFASSGDTHVGANEEEEARVPRPLRTRQSVCQGGPVYVPVSSEPNAWLDEVWSAKDNDNPNPNQTTMVHCSARSPLQMGDRVYTRTGQEGPITFVADASNMPFVCATGLVPDMCIDPTQYSVGQLMEMVYGRHMGSSWDEGHHHSPSAAWTPDALLSYGEEWMCCGDMGTCMETTVFVGMAYVQKTSSLPKDNPWTRNLRFPATLPSMDQTLPSMKVGCSAKDNPSKGGSLWGTVGSLPQIQGVTQWIRPVTTRAYIDDRSGQVHTSPLTQGPQSCVDLPVTTLDWVATLQQQGICPRFVTDRWVSRIDHPQYSTHLLHRRLHTQLPDLSMYYETCIAPHVSNRPLPRQPTTPSQVTLYHKGQYPADAAVADQREEEDLGSLELSLSFNQSQSQNQGQTSTCQEEEQQGTGDRAEKETEANVTWTHSADRFAHTWLQPVPHALASLPSTTRLCTPTYRSILLDIDEGSSADQAVPTSTQSQTKQFVVSK